MCSIVAGDETWGFQYDREMQHQNAEWKRRSKPDPKAIARSQTWRDIWFVSTILKEWSIRSSCHKVKRLMGLIASYMKMMKITMKRFWSGIRHVRPQYRESASQRLLHDNAPAHRLTIIANFFHQESHFNRQPLTIFDMRLLPLRATTFGTERKALCWYWEASTAILKDIPTERLKN